MLKKLGSTAAESCVIFIYAIGFIAIIGREQLDFLQTAQAPLVFALWVTGWMTLRLLGLGFRAALPWISITRGERRS